MTTAHKHITVCERIKLKPSNSTGFEMSIRVNIGSKRCEILLFQRFTRHFDTDYTLW